LTEKVDNSQPVTRSSLPAVSVSKKSKKKKKKKNKEATMSTGDRSGKSVDVDLEALSLDIDSSSHEARSNKKTSTSKNIKVHDTVDKDCKRSILKVDPKFLNAENELRRIFGSKVVSSFENANQSGSSRQGRVGRRGVYGHRKCILVSPSDHWPRWDGSLSMELLEAKDRNHFFR